MLTLLCVICRTQICRSYLQSHFLGTLPLIINKNKIKQKERKKIQTILKSFYWGFWANFLKLHNLQNINWTHPSWLSLPWNLKLTKSLRQKKKKQKKKHKNEHSAFIVAYYSVLHKMTLIGHAHSSQFSTSNVFLKMPENKITTNLFI